MKHEMHKGAKRFSQKGKKKTVVKHSIRTQIALIFIALLAGTLLCCWFLNSKFLGKYYISTKTEKINAAYEKIKEAAGGSFINKEELHDLTTFCFRDNVMFIIISQSEGVAYASPNGGEEFIGRPVSFTMAAIRKWSQIGQLFFLIRNQNTLPGRDGWRMEMDICW